MEQARPQLISQRFQTIFQRRWSSQLPRQILRLQVCVSAQHAQVLVARDARDLHNVQAFLEQTRCRLVTQVVKAAGEGMAHHQVQAVGFGLGTLLQGGDLMVGEWVSWNRFDTKSGGFQSFDVWSIGLPVGWLRQVDDSRQAAAFVMPLAQKASLPGSDWRIDVLGGAFGRHVERDDFWWVYGVYFDVGSGDDTYLPYLGASWELDEQWTVSAAMPWPAVMYAPSRDTVFRFGAAPSGAAWTLASNQADVDFQLGSWDFGVSAQKRLTGNVWGKIEAGVGGLRSLRVSGGEWKGPEFDLDASPYFSVGINFRPEIN